MEVRCLRVYVRIGVYVRACRRVNEFECVLVNICESVCIAFCVFECECVCISHARVCDALWSALVCLHSTDCMDR